MSKFSCIVLCVVAASLSRVQLAAAKEGKPSLHEYLGPIILECAKEHGVSEAEIEASKAKQSTAELKPCFSGCIFKKAGFLNSQGLYDLDSGVSFLRTLVKDDQQYNAFVTVAKKCAAVNGKAVSDGEAGCERSQMASACFWEHKDEIDLV